MTIEGWFGFGFIVVLTILIAAGFCVFVEGQLPYDSGKGLRYFILNADGDIIRSYTGIIDIEGNDGGYVLFDYNGKRYTYYNCYLESIADIED